MDELIRQIRLAAAAELYYLALFGTLVLPDICGALASDDGRATAAKYKAWLRENVPGQASDADTIYGLRCSLLHQGHSMPHGSHYPIAFVYPSPAFGQLHNLSTEVGDDRVGWLSIPIFVDEVTDGAMRWFGEYGKTATVKRNVEKFVRLRPNGLPPHHGGPVIA